MNKDAELYRDLDRLLLSKEQIAEKVRELGKQITEDFRAWPQMGR